MLPKYRVIRFLVGLIYRRILDLSGKTVYWDTTSLVVDRLTGNLGDDGYSTFVLRVRPVYQQQELSTNTK